MELRRIGNLLSGAGIHLIGFWNDDCLSKRAYAFSGVAKSYRFHDLLLASAGIQFVRVKWLVGSLELYHRSLGI